MKSEMMSENPARATAISCLSFALDGEARRICVRKFAEAGVKLRLVAPRSLAHATQLLDSGSVSFALAHLSARDGGVVSLAQNFAVRQVAFPPLLALTDWEPSPAEVEELRTMGAAWVTSLASLSELARPPIEALVKSAHWFSSQVERMPVGNILQLMGGAPPGMLTVMCPHAKMVGERDWNAHETTCTGGFADECPGWIARAYVRNGELIHAETPTQSGRDALATMLELEQGLARIHEVFIEPAVPNLGGSIQGNIIDAARVADEWARDSQAGIVLPPGTPGRRPPAGPPQAPATHGWNRAGTAPPFPPPRRAPSPPPIPSQRATNAEKPPPARDICMNRADQIVNQLPSLSAVAETDAAGAVLAHAGEGDAEVLCAVGVMCGQAIEEIGATLALGDISSWAMVTSSNTLYVVPDGRKSVVALGKKTGNPSGLLRPLLAAVKEEIP